MPAWWSLLSARYLAVGESAKAKIYAHRALALQGNHVLALSTLAQAYEFEGDVVNGRVYTQRLCRMSAEVNVCSDALLP